MDIHIIVNLYHLLIIVVSVQTPYALLESASP